LANISLNNPFISFGKPFLEKKLVLLPFKRTPYKAGRLVKGLVIRPCFSSLIICFNWISPSRCSLVFCQWLGIKVILACQSGFKLVNHVVVVCKSA